MKKRKKDFLALLKKEGIGKKIINVFEELDQELFFDRIFQSYYYSDEPIPIGLSEKSDPSVILAKMINYLSPDKDSRILEIGTGSGYSTAVLSRLVNEVVTVEYHESLAVSAKERLVKLQADNIRYLTGDIADMGAGVPGMFDRIIIFAALTQRPLFLLPHLKEKGIVVFPMGPLFQQQITVLKNEDGDKDSMFKTQFFETCVFTPIKNI